MTTNIDVRDDDYASDRMRAMKIAQVAMVMALPHLPPDVARRVDEAAVELGKFITPYGKRL